MSTTAEKIKVMQAFEDGAVIELRAPTPDNRFKWKECRHPTWNWSVFEYRVKPQPKIIYVNEYSTMLGQVKLDLSAHHTAQEALVESKRISAKTRSYIELTPELEQLAKENKII